MSGFYEYTAPLCYCLCHGLLLYCLYLCALCKTSKEPDRMDVLMVRSHGISVIGASVPWLLLHDTRDATVHITLMMNHVVVSFSLQFCLLKCECISLYLSILTAIFEADLG